MNDGKNTIKASSDKINHYHKLGYTFGKVKVEKPIKLTPSERKEQRRAKRKSEIYASVKPFFERYINGESLREVALDYGTSHITLLNDIRLCFSEHLDSVKHGSKKKT